MTALAITVRNACRSIALATTAHNAYWSTAHRSTTLAITAHNAYWKPR